MKIAKKAIYRNVHAVPTLRFEDQQLTSFSGLVVFQVLFARLRLKERLQQCVSHLHSTGVYRLDTILQCLIVHILLGYRKLQDRAYYGDDPMVQRMLGIEQLPSVPTLSRMLREFDGASVEKQWQMNRELVTAAAQRGEFTRVTLDFDGSVQSTKRHAEGTAVGFNKHQKGARSYYPLFCTVAQMGQVFDVWHRPGNVHDSHDAPAFVRACVQEWRAALPGMILEVRMDSAFFSEEMVTLLDELGVLYTVSVPFERLAELKQRIEQRRWWWRMAGEQAYFEAHWKPKCWSLKHRFVFVRARVAQQRKEPIQLDLFTPQVYGYEFKVILTNHGAGARHVVAFHEGRGYQEHVFGELKTDGAMAYVPTQTCLGNQVYLWAGIMAHNLAREVQMRVAQPARRTTEKRSPLWCFHSLRHLRQLWIQRAGRFTRPGGELTLTLSANPAVQQAFLQYLQDAA